MAATSTVCHLPVKDNGNSTGFLDDFPFSVPGGDVMAMTTTARQISTIHEVGNGPVGAARSSHYNEGFLLERNTDSRLVFSDQLHPGVELYARRILELDSCHDELGEEAALGLPENSPLFERGWALQERLLSPRVLHFMCSELIFECQSRARCECAARGYLYKGLKADDGEGPDTGNQRLSMHKRWCRLVEQYTRRRLTYPLDILPAFSAIARIHTTGYLAGLRADYLLFDLLWYSEVYNDPETGARSEPTRPEIYTAPSFSWTSVLGPIECAHVIWLRYFRSRVEDFFVSLENPDDPFGRVKDGWIRLRAPVVQATLSYVQETQPASLLGWVRRRSHQIDVNLDVADGPPPDTSVICVTLSEKLGAREPYSFGLVLKQSQTRVGTYERVDCFLNAPESFFQGSKEESITIV